MTLENIQQKLMELKQGQALTLKVKIIPKSSKNEIVGLMKNQQMIKIKITAAPEKGKANQQLIKFLSQEFSIRQNQIRIKSGEHSNLKILEIQPSIQLR